MTKTTPHIAVTKKGTVWFHATRIPPSAGPAIAAVSNAVVFQAMALGKMGSGTSDGTNAVRAGQPIAFATPAMNRTP